MLAAWAASRRRWDRIALGTIFLAGATGVTPGYTPATPPDISTGLQLAAVGAPQPGVVYPTAGDGILGTSVDPGATAFWSYIATIPLTPAQVALLTDPNQVQVVRNVAHIETLEIQLDGFRERQLLLEHLDKAERVFDVRFQNCDFGARRRQLYKLAQVFERGDFELTVERRGGL